MEESILRMGKGGREGKGGRGREGGEGREGEGEEGRDLSREGGRNISRDEGEKRGEVRGKEVLALGSRSPPSIYNPAQGQTINHFVHTKKSQTTQTFFLFCSSIVMRARMYLRVPEKVLR